MKSSSLTALSFLTAILFLLTACNSSDENKTESTTVSDSSAKSTTSTPTTSPTANTIITTPQSMLVIKHKVKDFAAWKIAYDAHDSTRLASGLHNYVLSRGVNDSNMVMVSLKADDMAKAKAFANDPGLKHAMQKGGVVGTPSFQFTTMTFQDTVTLSPNINRSITVFNVKDWAAWEKAFKEGEQERIDNGIAVRAYGHDADNNNKVRLVTALTDTAKAHAYWKSDMLKKRRAASGVISEPDRFVYHIVQRY